MFKKNNCIFEKLKKIFVGYSGKRWPAMPDYTNELEKIDLENLINFYQIANGLPDNKKINLNIAGCPYCKQFNVDFSTNNISKIERNKWISHQSGCKVPLGDISIDYLIRPDFLITSNYSVLFLVSKNKFIKLLFDKTSAASSKNVVNIQSGKLIGNPSFVDINTATTNFERKELFLKRLSGHLKKNYKLVILNFTFPLLNNKKNDNLFDIKSFLNWFDVLGINTLRDILSLLKESNINEFYYCYSNFKFEKKLISEAYGQTISTSKYKQKIKEVLDNFEIDNKSGSLDSKVAALKISSEEKINHGALIKELDKEKEKQAPKLLNKILLWEKYLIGEVPKEEPGSHIIIVGRTAFSRFNNLIIDKKVIRLSKEHLPEIFTYNPRFLAYNKLNLPEKSYTSLSNTLSVINNENLNTLYPDVKAFKQPRELVFSLIVDNLSEHIKNSIYKYLPLFFIKAAREIEVNKVENMNLVINENEKSIVFFNSSEEVVEAIIRKSLDSNNKSITEEFYKVAAELILNGWTLEIPKKEEKNEYKLLTDLMEV